MSFFQNALDDPSALFPATDEAATRTAALRRLLTEAGGLRPGSTTSPSPSGNYLDRYSPAANIFANPFAASRGIPAPEPPPMREYSVPKMQDAVPEENYDPQWAMLRKSMDIKGPPKENTQLAAIQKYLSESRPDFTLGTADVNRNLSAAAPASGGYFRSAATAPEPNGFQYNFGNIRHYPNLAWAGAGEPYQGFVTFGTPEEGARAMLQNLTYYSRNNRGMTVAQAINKWSPAEDNNDPAAYIEGIQTMTGIRPGAPLADVLSDPDSAGKIMHAMATIEKGQGPVRRYGREFFTKIAADYPRTGQRNP